MSIKLGKKLTGLALCLALSAAGVYANTLSEVQINAADSGYAIVLKTDSEARMKKVISSPDKMYIELKDVQASDELNTVYNNVANIENVTIQPVSKNDLKITLQGKDISSGKILFEKYVPGQMVVLEKNEDYYDESRMPKIDEAQIYIMGDDSAVLTALQSGQLDAGIVYADSADYLTGDFTVNSSPQNMVQLFALNNSATPFDDVRVRQAFEYAVNKDQIIDGVFAGYATELYSNFSPVMSYFYNDELEDVYTYDVDKAKELMAEAGYEDGFDITITVPSNYQKHIDTAQVIAQQLKQINVNATIEPVEWGQWLEQVYTNADYQTTVVGLTGKLDPNDILGRYVSDYAKNFMKYNNPDYDKLIEEAKTASDEERVELF